MNLYELASYVDAGYIKDIKDEPFMKYIRGHRLDTVTIDGGVYGIRWIHRHGVSSIIRIYLTRLVFRKFRLR